MNKILFKPNKKMNCYFVPKINKHYARHMFLKMKPRHGESKISHWTRLREQVYDCNFNERCEDRISEHFIQTVGNPKLIQKCIRKELTLFEFLVEAQKAEEISEKTPFMGYWQAKDTLKLNRK